MSKRNGANGAAGGTGVPIALTYTRVSSDDQERDGMSLAAQLADCRRYNAAHEWTIGAEFTDTMTGKRNDRADYQALLAEARRLRAAGHVVVVTCKWLHRFGRKVSERVRAWEELADLGIAIHSVAEGGRQSKLVYDILASVAEEESRQIGERVAAVWSHADSLGWTKIGGGKWGAAWGYQSRDATADERRAGSPNTVLEPDPERASYAAQVFERVAAGEPIRVVARWAAGLPDDIRNGRSLQTNTVQNILRNPIYAGRTESGVSGRWTPIVDPQVFDKVQERFASHRSMPRQASANYLLTGLIRCHQCGRRMQGDAARNGRRYRCESSKRGGHGVERCNGTADQARMDAALRGRVAALLEPLTNADALRAAFANRTDATRDGAEAQQRERTRLEQIAATARKRISQATRLFVDDQLDRDGYDGMVAEERSSLEAAEAELARINIAAAPQQQQLSLDEVFGQVGSWLAILEDADLRAQREVLMLLVDQVKAVRVKPGVYDADVQWTALGATLSKMIAAAA